MKIEPSGLPRQLQRDFRRQFVGQVHVAATPAAARLHVHLRGLGIHGLHTDPHGLLVDLAFERARGVGVVVRDVFGEQHAVVLDDDDGGLIDLVNRALVAVAQRVLAPGAGEGVRVADGLDAAGGGDGGSGEDG